MSEPFLGEIRPFAGTFAPRGWMTCSGQLVSIASYDALFTLIGTTYGGDGQSTFGLPDLRGRVAVGQGTGPGLSNYVVGQMAGEEQHTLTVLEMASHTHGVTANAGEATSAQATGKLPSAPKNEGKFFLPPNVGTQTVVSADPNAIGASGGNQPHLNLMPVTAITYIIAVEGIFPSRN